MKAFDGYLFPLKSSLVFIHKPIHYIKLAEIKYVEFSRVGGASVGMPASRSFDMTVTKMKDDTQVTFAGIDKQEHKNLINYLKAKNIKMRSVDVETNREIDLSEGEEDEEEDSERLSGGKGAKRAKGDASASKGVNDDYDDEDEDDESFKEDGSQKDDGSGDDEEDGEGDESGEDEDDDDEDADMDDGIDKDELKALQKEAGLEAGGDGRGRRGARGAAQ